MSKRRENFTGEFDGCDANRQFEVRVRFKNIKNEKGILFKKHILISEKQARDTNLIGNLTMDKMYGFTAKIEEDPEYEDGFQLVDIIFNEKF
jgi:hypothetical protein